MNYRIEITPLRKWRDSRGESVKKQITDFLNIDVDQVRTRDVYTVSADINDEQAAAVARGLANPVLQSGTVGESIPEAAADWLVSVGFKPGVTDNVGRSAKEAVGDIIGRKLRDGEKVFSSVEYMLYGRHLDRKAVEHISRDLLANELIESVSVFAGEDAARGIPLNMPRVTASGGGNVNEYNLEVSDEELMEISRKGILALSIDEMKAIQSYFRSCSGRNEYGLSSNPTDVELEVLAQTWSEHCKHKIFAAEIDYNDTESGKNEKIVSCYKTFIMKSTHEISEEVDWLVSVFHDNAGVIAFNDKVDLVYKVETHNSPSALDPYGGAMTGIVGVNRDPMGTGQGADLLINVWGYCLGSPFTKEQEVPEGLLHPRRLRDGIHKGVIDGGNQSGIPYGLGWEYFEDRYLGKPLVYCGTVGTLPCEINGIKGFEKEIKPGDLIVMAGGRIGKDGIHGATFSSEELHQDSPTQAVQIGDPITQKKMSDFIYEARSRSLYRFVTDNGAGGLSSSIGEMAELCGGCCMDLKKAPLKYAGLDPWEILVSEAQERMSFAVPQENIEKFKQLAADRDVEVTVMGEFTDSGKFHMKYGDKTVALLDIEFMHDGLPRMQLKAEWKRPEFKEPVIDGRDCGADLQKLAARLNICSDEYKARQYDHEVKGLSVIKPFVGVKRDVVSDATVTMIEQLSTEGVILSEGILPRYSDIDTYHMMASIIDLAVRRIIAVGGKLGHIAGLDNFCWPDPVQSEKTPDGKYKLAQLVRANQALYDYTKAFKVPCISGKDSMKNDSTRGGRKISIPPTVLFSAISKMDDIRKAVTLDAKFAGDLVYVIGDTANELGGSEYYFMLNETGNNVPQVNAEKAVEIYNAVSRVTEAELANSLHTPALGGLGVAFARVAMGGRLGLEIDTDKIPVNGELTLTQKLFSESNSRFVMTVAPENVAKIEALLGEVPFAQVGKVVNTKSLEFKANGAKVTNISLDAILNGYKKTLDQI
ncbi:AIR synthase-related protein [Lentisphaerota bacterium ZTH]|nr:phosphoribosylformylglycinamidine synthase [Lentisphaerota bacterium]WET07599.1 AIR synthase-related protein [Lentisphaerota bacterium ZTH]